MDYNRDYKTVNRYTQISAYVRNIRRLSLKSAYRMYAHTQGGGGGGAYTMFGCTTNIVSLSLSVSLSLAVAVELSLTPSLSRTRSLSRARARALSQAFLLSLSLAFPFVQSYSLVCINHVPSGQSPE